MFITVPILLRGTHHRHRRREDFPLRSHHRRVITGRGTLRRRRHQGIKVTSIMISTHLRHRSTSTTSTMMTTMVVVHFSEAAWAHSVAAACFKNAAAATSKISAIGLPENK